MQQSDVQDIQLLISQFDIQYEQYCEHKEEQLRQSVEQISHQMVGLVHQWKSEQVSVMSLDHHQQIIVMINQIKKQYEQIISVSAQIINQQSRFYDRMMMQYDGRLEFIKCLKQCGDYFHIRDHTKISQYKQEIQQLQQSDDDGLYYQIMIDFSNCYFPTIDDKMQLLEMIHTLNADHKVGIVKLEISSSNKLNQEIVIIMMNRYFNVYDINLNDWNDPIDYEMHKLLKQWVQQQPVMRFDLRFKGALYDKDDSYELIRQYNQLIKQKQCLGNLTYSHQMFDGWIYARSEEDLEHMIDEVDKL